jgi:hypothetical protein
MAAAEFYLFLRLKSAQNDFKACFQHIYCRWQKDIIAQGDHFEGNVPKMIAMCCISQK